MFGAARQEYLRFEGMPCFATEQSIGGAENLGEADEC